jgi:nitrous oxidase accessory protein NosD
MRRAIAATAMMCVAAAAPAGARTVQVFPRRGALQRALLTANAGETLVVHGGHYYGQALVGDPRIKLVGAPGPRPVIDGRCKTNYTIEIAAAGVELRHLTVIGAAEGFGQFPSAVNFDSQPTGSAQDLVVRNTCDAEYGINVIRGSRQQIVENTATGFRDSGIYVGQITQQGRGAPLRVSGNRTDGNSRGIIIEFSHRDDIRVVDNVMNGNRLAGLRETPPAGLLLNGADGVLVRGNKANHNGRYGFDLIAGSSHNRFIGNDFAQNPRNLHVAAGSGPNCGTLNVPDVFAPC